MSSMLSEDDLLEERAQSSALQEGLVLVAFTLVAVAIAIALHLHLGWPLWHAIVVGTCLYLAVLAAHGLLRRSAAIRQLEGELDALEDELDALRTLRTGGQQAAAPHAAQPPPPAVGVRREATASAAVKVPPATSADARLSVDPRHTPPPPPTPKRLDAPGGAGQDAAGPKLDTGTLDTRVDRDGSASSKGSPPLVADAPLVPVPGTRIAPGRDALPSFGPSSGPSLGPASASISGQPQQSGARRNALPRNVPDSELDKIDDLIRKLAVDLGGAPPSRTGKADPVASPGAPPAQAAASTSAAIVATAPVERRGPPPPPPASVATTSSASVKSADAKSGAAEARRAMPGSATEGAVSTRPLTGAMVSAAIRNDSLDLFIEPIMGLDVLKARYFSVAVHLRTEDDRLLSRGDYLSYVEEQRMQAQLDVRSVKRAARVVEHIAGRGRETALLAKLASVSLSDEAFLDTFADLMDTNPDLAKSLIFSIRQGEVRHLSKPQWETIETMSEMGIGVAIDEVTDLEMDFEMLFARGVRFVRLDAGHFVEGMRAGSHVIPPRDVCTFLSKLGYELIVDHIDDEKTLAQVCSLGAVLGQGSIFGGPKRVKSDIQRKI